MSAVPSPASALAALLIGLATAAPLVAQSPTAEPMTLTRLARPITLDGRPTAEEWRDVPALPLTLYAPVFRGTPKQRTEIRVAYDDDYFYAAGWFYDDDPSGVRVNSLYRDRWNGDDAFAIYIDAFNDNQNAKWFGTTPAGMRFDQLVSDDGNTLNGSWDTFWNSATTVSDSGWFAEVRIPFSSIGFRAVDGRAVMGLTVSRLVSRTGERVTWPEIDPKFEFRRPSIAQDVVLRDVQTRRPLYVTPYVLGSSSRSLVPPAEGAAPLRFDADDRYAREVGLDVRYPVTSDLTLDLTVNTDFAQVEADDQVVNLDRFPLFFPDKRRFFQENSGIFDFTMGGNARLFHSRRIGLVQNPTTFAFVPLPVLGGARLAGRMGAWDVGFLEMQTQEQGLYPSENFGVLRLRRPVINPWSTVGMMATSYVGGGRQNLALGADGVFRVRGDDYLTLKLASTMDDGDDDAPLLDRTTIDARWQRRVSRGLQFEVAGVRSGPAFRPELGFLSRRGFTTANAFGNYFIFTDRHRWLRRVYPGALALHTFRDSDGALESAQWAVWVQWDTKTGGGGWIEPKVFHENVADAFRIGGTVDVPRGVYDFADLQLALMMNSGSRVRTSLDARAGTYFDGTRAQAILTPTWNVSPHLELGMDYQLTSLRFPVRDQKADIQVARLRLRAAKDVRMSGNAFVQYNSTTDDVDVNVRLRYAFAEGTDLWLVYNEELDTERAYTTAGLQPPLSRSRAFIVKYSHTLGF